MGLTAGTILGIASLAVGTTGAVMSYQAQSAAAKSQSTFGLLNAQSAAQQAKNQGRQQMLGAQIQAASARAQAASAENNAVAIQQQTEADSRAATENIRRDREAFARTLGAIRAAGSDSGVLETTGSPLDFAAAAVQDQQLYESEQRWQDESARRGGFRKAALERAGASQSRLNSDLLMIDGAASLAAGRVGAAQARLDGYAARASAAGIQAGATAGLVSNIGGLGMSSYQMYQNRTPKKTTTGWTGVKAG